MKDHQRYFPLVGQDGKLLPMFLTVRNGSDHSIEVVQAGNERVLRARLDDAKFFFNEDRKKPLIDRQDGLTKIVFQEGLGNLADKTERLLKLGLVLVKNVVYTKMQLLYWNALQSLLKLTLQQVWLQSSLNYKV